MLLVTITVAGNQIEYLIFTRITSMLPNIVKLSCNYKRFPMTVLIFC